MWLLVVSTLIVSDTGMPTVQMQSIRLHDPGACARMKRRFTFEGEHRVLGHKYHVRSSAECELDAPGGGDFAM